MLLFKATLFGWVLHRDVGGLCPGAPSPAVVSTDGQAGAQAGSNKSPLVSGAIFINHKLTEVGRDLGHLSVQALAGHSARYMRQLRTFSR